MSLKLLVLLPCREEQIDSKAQWIRKQRLELHNHE
uniref:Uncharacterized protein n=1 Tax=Rhizophora mucronata TaxID=61149 RepID=A0A2P2N667_RHIMU